MYKLKLKKRIRSILTGIQGILLKKKKQQKFISPLLPLHINNIQYVNTLLIFNYLSIM